jgi:hypothetical protein
MPAMELVNHASWLGASGLILDPTRDYATANERPCTPPDLAHLVVVGLLAYREPVQAHVPTRCGRCGGIESRGRDSHTLDRHTGSVVLAFNFRPGRRPSAAAVACGDDSRFTRLR